MSLQGTPFLVLLAVLAVGLPAATVLCWRRVRGPRAVRATQRGGLLAASQLAAVLVVVVALNNYGDFYSSWTDLFHGQPRQVTVSAVRPATPSGSAPAGGIRALPTPGSTAGAGATAGAPGPRDWLRTGRLERLEIVGANSQLRRRADVWFPPQYFQPGYAHSRFPAIEVFADPADPADPGADQARTAYIASLRSLVESGRARPAVLVLLYPPDGATMAQCTDPPGGRQAGTFAAIDVPSQLTARYRILAVDWGTLGTGSGGYCAVKTAMTRSRVFRAAVSVNGLYTAPVDPLTGADRAALWGDSPVLAAEGDLQWRLQHLPAPPVSVLAVSRDPAATRSGQAQSGQAQYGQAQRFATLAREPMKVSLVSPPDGDTSSAAAMQAQLTWLTMLLPKVELP